jgi:hypothetical protein
MPITFHASYVNNKVGNGHIPFYIGEMFWVSGPNWSNANTRRMLQLLGLPFREDLSGNASIHKVLRELTYVRTKFNELAPKYVCRGGTEHICGRCALMVAELTLDDIKSKLEEFNSFAVRALQDGAKSIYWC